MVFRWLGVQSGECRAETVPDRVVSFSVSVSISVSVDDIGIRCEGPVSAIADIFLNRFRPRELSCRAQRTGRGPMAMESFQFPRNWQLSQLADQHFFSEERGFMRSLQKQSLSGAVCYENGVQSAWSGDDKISEAGGRDSQLPDQTGDKSRWCAFVRKTAFWPDLIKTGHSEEREQ